VSVIPIDGKVFGFTFCVSCLTGILFGMAPAFTAWHGNVAVPLKESGRGTSGGPSNRLRHILVASEVALALVVLCGAGLMIESMARLLKVDPGFNPKNVLTMEMSLPQDNLYNGPPGDARFCQVIDERVGAIAGVLAVGAVAHLPMEGNASRSFQIEGRPDPGPENEPYANYSVACPNYFRALGVPLLEGREFNPNDIQTSPGVIVINQSMARQHWPNEDALGKRIKQGGAWLTVVGVVGDVRHWGLDQQSYAQFFRPYTQAAWPLMSVVIRAAGPPASYAAAAKKAISEVEPERPVSNPETMESIIAHSVGSRRFPMLLLSGLAALALVLAAVGIVGVVSYTVAQRTREIGIRLALGALPLDVLKLMITRSMTWVLVGVAVGIGGSLAVTRWLGDLLFAIQPSNPWVLSAVALLLVCVALFASFIPARRAARVDPMVALRYE